MKSLSFVLFLGLSLMAVLASDDRAWASRPCHLLMVELERDGSMTVEWKSNRKAVSLQNLVAVVSKEDRRARQVSCYSGKVHLLYDPDVRLSVMTQVLDALQAGGFYDVDVIDRSTIPPPPPPPQPN